MTTKKPKILHLITGLEIGGAEVMLAQVLPKLTNFEHVVCSLTTKGPIGQKIEENGIKVYELIGGKKLSLSAISEFGNIIKKEEPDIISTRLIHADIFGRVFGHFYGIQTVICGLESVLEDKKYNKFFILERLTTFLVTKYFAVSNAVKNKYTNKAKIKPPRIEVVYNGIDLEKFNDLPDKEAAKKTLGYTGSDILIGYVAKLRAERNHSSLITAFSLLVKKFPGTRLVIAGDGPEKENLIKLSKDLHVSERVDFLGNRNDVPLILKSLDVFVSPSAYEGMSIAILEAMASGLPIVASDIEPNRELIENNVDGYLVDPFNPSAIAERISALIENPGTQTVFASKAKERSKKFSIENTVNKLDKLYRAAAYIDVGTNK